MKKRKLMIFLGSIIGVATPLFVASCGNNDKKQLIDEKEDETSSSTTGKTEATTNSGFLSSSQLQEVKESFLFNLTPAGQLLSYEERMEIIKKIRKDSYPQDSGVSSQSITPEYTFNRVQQNEQFKKYFNFVSVEGKKFGYLNGHKLEMEFVVEDNIKHKTAIRYVLRCPDKIYKGRMAVEAEEYIYLDE